MKKLVLFIMLAIVMFSFNVFAQEAADAPQEIAWQSEAWGEYQIVGNRLIARMNTPLMAERLVTYGNVIINKDRVREVNVAHKGLVTPKGNQLYQQIMMLTSPGGVFQVASVTLEHAAVAVVWYDRFDEGEVVPPMLKIFDAVFGQPEAPKE